MESNLREVAPTICGKNGTNNAQALSAAPRGEDMMAEETRRAGTVVEEGRGFFRFRADRRFDSDGL